MPQGAQVMVDNIITEEKSHLKQLPELKKLTALKQDDEGKASEILLRL